MHIWHMPPKLPLVGEDGGVWPPVQPNLLKMITAIFSYAVGHNKAYESIKQVSKKPVGIGLKT